MPVLGIHICPQPSDPFECQEDRAVSDSVPGGAGSPHCLHYLSTFTASCLVFDTHQPEGLNIVLAGEEKARAYKVPRVSHPPFPAPPRPNHPPPL